MRGCSCFLKSSIISRMSSWTPDAVPDEEMKKNNFLFVTYTIIQSITSSEICALQPIQVQTHLEQWAANAAAPREQLGVRCLAQGSYLSRGQFLPEPRFEPTTLGYKSDALSIRPRLPPWQGRWRTMFLVGWTGQMGPQLAHGVCDCNCCLST